MGTGAKLKKIVGGGADPSICRQKTKISLFRSHLISHRPACVCFWARLGHLVGLFETGAKLKKIVGGGADPPICRQKQKISFVSLLRGVRGGQRCPFHEKL